MVRPDDCSLTASKNLLIRKHAEQALRSADAFGVLPTPVGDVMHAAQVLVADDDLADEGLLARVRKGGRSRRCTSPCPRQSARSPPCRRASGHQQGGSRCQATFSQLHETAHAVLPWQRDITAVTEDCQKTLAPEIADEFEREANAFATEVIFQLDTFTREAADHDFNILVPVRLSKKYGGSIYSAVRRYVSTHHRSCTVLILDPPKTEDICGFTCELRRVVTSASFSSKPLGELIWPESFSPDDEIGAAVPVGGKKMSGKVGGVRSATVMAPTISVWPRHSHKRTKSLS